MLKVKNENHRSTKKQGAKSAQTSTPAKEGDVTN